MALPAFLKVCPSDRPGFTAQFARVLTCQRGLRHAGAILRQQGLPWMVGCRYAQETGLWSGDYTKDYDELKALAPVPKARQLSVISSDKAQTPGHRRRLDFAARLREHFGDGIDVYGRGLRPFGDKWDVLTPYKYHVVLENGEYPDYWTEKLSDALLAGAYPFYAGCPNIGDYFPDGVLTLLDLDDPVGAIQAIERGMAGDRFEATEGDRRAAAARLLDEYNLFPTLEKLILDTRRETPARPVRLRPQSAFAGTFLSKAKMTVRRVLQKN